MTPAPAELEGAVELLERSLGYTRVALAEIQPDHLDRPTPCADWTLARLLAHMEDALDAFTEAADGHVTVTPAPAPATYSRVDALREKACALLGAWAATRPNGVAVGDRAIEPALLVSTAALEITVHGWDVAQATGARTAIPGALAAGLMPVAERTVAQADRGRRFQRPLPVSVDAPADARLLAFLGRNLTGPPGTSCGERPAPPHVAS